MESEIGDGGARLVLLRFFSATLWCVGNGGASAMCADDVDCRSIPNTTDNGERLRVLGRGEGGTKGKFASTESVREADDRTDSREVRLDVEP